MQKRYYKHKLENLINIANVVTIHYFEFDKSFVGERESHDFWELVYADKGGIVCEAEEKEIFLNEGELLFHKPNENHSLRANGKTAPNVFIVSFVCKNEAMRFFEEKKLKLDKRFLRFIYAIVEESKQTFDIPYSDPALKKMKLLAEPSLGGQQMIKNYLELLLISIMRSETEKPDTEAVFLPQAERGERIAEQVVAFLKSHLYERLDVADVCEALHYNKSYIFRQFKQATNRSVMAYFQGLKIEEAKRLLRETEKNVSDIANALAFDTPNYFSKVFKKQTGYTPMRYKKMRKN